jgi:holo-[acyl-carrier protein] synthase
MTRTSTRLRVGTDLQAVAEVADALARYGERYTRRLFTADEVSAAGGVCAAAAPRLAARFAAKEAVFKLLSPTDTIPRWRSIEIRTAADGAPSVHLADEAAELARARGLDDIAISMTHGAGMAAATVVALVTDNQGTRDG